MNYFKEKLPVLRRNRKRQKEESGPAEQGHQAQPEQQRQQQEPSQPVQAPSNVSVDDSDAALSLQNGQSSLWDQAYDGLKQSQPKVVSSYERLLSEILRREEHPNSHADNDNNLTIATAADERCQQMKRLVDVGLARSERVAAVKGKIGDALGPAKIVKGMVDKGMSASPEASVAWAAVSFTLEIITNPVEEAKSNRDGITYVLSRTEWYHALESYVLGDGLSSLHSELSKHIVELYKALLLFQMSSICLYHRNAFAVVLRDLVQLDNWPGQLDSVKAAENQVIRDYETYSTEQVKHYLKDLIKGSGSIRKALGDVQSAIEHQTQQQADIHRSTEDKQCLKDLFETDPSDDKERIEERKGGLLKDSYSWVLQHPDFQKFRNDSQSRLLWIRGDPGKGKTMLMCGIIDELENIPSPPSMAYFFCQATEPRLSNADSVLRGLVYHFVTRYPSLLKHVRKEHEGKREKFLETNTWQVLSAILLDIFEDSAMKHCVIMVDALDECTTGRSQLLDFIVRCPPTIKWIVTSRSYPDIVSKLDDLGRQVSLSLELNVTAIAGAVGFYIRHKAGKLAKEKSLSNELRQEMETYFENHAEGTFLWVALVYETLNASSMSKRTFRRSKPWESFPEGLVPLYRRMIQDVLSSQDAKLCKQVLAVTSLAYRPLALRELACLVEADGEFLRDDDDEEVQEVITYCGSFLTVRQGMVYFVHQSAKDFLDGEGGNQIMASGVAHQHFLIFQRALEVLSQTLRRDMYSLKSYGFLRSEIDGVKSGTDRLDPSDVEDFRPKIDEPGSSVGKSALIVEGPRVGMATPGNDALLAARYSCVHWVSHLQASIPDLHQRANDVFAENGLLHVFLCDKFLYWLEALSLLDSYSQGLQAILELDQLTNQMGATPLKDFLQDAVLFSRFHRRAIEAAPLQVYASALLFSPMRSIVRNTFWDTEMKWATCGPGLQDDWSALLIETSAPQLRKRSSNYSKDLFFSPDGQRLACVRRSWDISYASGVEDETTYVSIWDVRTGSHQHTIEDSSRVPKRFAFTADGQGIESRRADGTVQRWGPAFNDEQSDVVVICDRRHILESIESAISVKKGGRVKDPYNTEPEAKNRPFAASHSASDMDSVSDSDSDSDSSSGSWESSSDLQWMEISPDGGYLARDTQRKSVEVWSTQIGTCLHAWRVEEDGPQLLVFSDDSKLLASGSSRGRKVYVWNIESGACLYKLALQLSFSSNSDFQGLTGLNFIHDCRLAVASFNLQVRWILEFWDLRSGNYLGYFQSDFDCASLTLSRQKDRLATCKGDGALQIWDWSILSKTLKNSRDPNERTATSWHAIPWTPDCPWFAVQFAQGDNQGTKTPKMHLWGSEEPEPCILEVGETLKTWERLDSIVCSEGGRFVASRTTSKTTEWRLGSEVPSENGPFWVHIWDTKEENDKCMHALRLDAYVEELEFSANGTRFATYTDNEEGTAWIKIWDTHSGQCQHTVKLSADDEVTWTTGPSALAFSRDGQFLAAGGGGMVKNREHRWRRYWVVHIWDVAATRDSPRHLQSICSTPLLRGKFSPEQRQYLSEHPRLPFGGLYSIAFSPAEDTIVIKPKLEVDAEVWNWKDAKALYSFPCRHAGSQHFFHRTPDLVKVDPVRPERLYLCGQDATTTVDLPAIDTLHLSQYGAEKRFFQGFRKDRGNNGCWLHKNHERMLWVPSSHAPQSVPTRQGLVSYVPGTDRFMLTNFTSTTPWEKVSSHD